MRITEKMENGFYKLKKDFEIYGTENGIRLVQIIGMHEDIEERLGVCYNAFIIALTDFYYVKIKYPSGLVRREKRYGRDTTVSKIGNDFVFDYGECYCVELKDYGKTWALTKEELE